MDERAPYVSLQESGMKALIDADLVAYRCAASCEKQGVVTEDFGVACQRADNLIQKQILDPLQATSHKLFLSGGENFRKKILPSYKANREGQRRPEYLEPLRGWLASVWNTTVTDGTEADDALAIAQTAAEDGTTIICTLDKDLRQVPGLHYSWAIEGTSTTGNKWEKPANKALVDEATGLLNFYWQLIMGDKADNIFGFDGKARDKIPNFLQDLRDEMEFASHMGIEQDLFDIVREKYSDDTRLLMNAQCMWMLRYEGQDWLQEIGNQLLEKSGTGDSGQKEDSTLS